MADTEVRITLRLPEGLRDRLASASLMNNRSMNGEIVDRLKYTFGGVDDELTALFVRIQELEASNTELIEKNRQLKRFQDVYEQMGEDNARVSAGWEEWATRQFTDENTAYVVLDGEGVPLCWDEVLIHLQAIREAFGDAVERIEANFIDTKKEPRERRVEQLARLTEFYRTKATEGS